MNIAIRYYSKTGNTKKLAQAIAESAGVPAKTVGEPLEGHVDILFLGSSVYAAGVDPQVKEFIEKLDSSVGCVVNFSTAALMSSTYNQIAKLLTVKGISLDKREFHCRGKFKIMHKDRPNEADLASVKAFTKEILEVKEKV